MWLCNLERHRRFGWAFYFHLQGTRTNRDMIKVVRTVAVTTTQRHHEQLYNFWSTEYFAVTTLTFLTSPRVRIITHPWFMSSFRWFPLRTVTLFACSATSISFLLHFFPFSTDSCRSVKDCGIFFFVCLSVWGGPESLGIFVSSP
jgi:hypothetical protein